MRNHKRFIALILVVVMTFGGAIMSVSAAKLTDAEKYTDKGALTGISLAYAIDVLQQLGIVAGVSNVKDDDGNVIEYTFDGDSLVTRQQFALFTARIETALPNRFVVDSSSAVASTSGFPDLVDDTYTLAIDYCAKEGFVIGRDDGSFDPKATIQFQEAVTMLTRALGYTGLSYPMGFITKASEGGVGIKEPIALIGEYADFPMDDVALNTPITRTHMAKLLWNYLLSQKYELELVLNPTTNQVDQQRVAHPILKNFGIERTIGYVTAVPGWFAELDVGYRALDAAGNVVPVPLVGGGLSAANTAFQVMRDICISPLNGSKNIVTTMEKLGLGAYRADPLELLGLKVTVYEDKRPNPAFNINIPTLIQGKKIEIDIEEVDGAYNTANNGLIDSLSIPFPAIEDTAMDMADFFAPGLPNLYTFDDAAVLKGVKGAQGVADAIYLAQKAANKTNYRLELVYNGEYSDGTPEYFYIFRPFKVGVYVNNAKKAAPNNIVFTTDVADDATNVEKVVAHAASFKDKDITELTLNKAYLYTYYGANLDIYAELTEDAGAVPTAANFNTQRVDFKLPAGTKSVFFNNGSPKADGAWGAAAPHITPDGKGVYTVYYDGAAALLARRTGDGPDEYQRSQYVVILSLSATREVTLRNPENTSVITGQAYRAKVFNAQTGKEDTIMIYNINGEVIDYGVNSPEWLAMIGIPVRLVNKGPDYYDIATEDNENFITHVAAKEYAGAAHPGAAANLPATTNRITLPTIWPSSLLPGTPNISTFINANTNIVIYGPTEYKIAGDPTSAVYGAVRHTGNQKGLDYLKTLLSSAAVKGYLIGVGLGVTPTGTAGYVFLEIKADAANTTIAGPPASTGNYAMVLNNDPLIIYGGYYYGTARLANGTTVSVASKTASDIQRGRLVELSGTIVNAYDVDYTLAASKDNRLDFGTDPAVFGNFNSYFASPTSLSTYKAGQLDTYGHTLTDYSADFGFEIADPDSFDFDKNIFKVIVAYTAEVTAADNTVTPPISATYAPKLVTEGRPTIADPNVKEQFIAISNTEYDRIKGNIYMVTYTAGTGADREVVFATMLIDLRDVKDAAGEYVLPFFWRD